MPKQLAPDSKVRNPDMLEQRLAMLRNGWPPIPCEAKGRVPLSWSKFTIDEAAIRDWAANGLPAYIDKRTKQLVYRKFKGTGIRVEGDIFVLDLDIKDRALMDKTLAAIDERFPDWLYDALWRSSGGVSLGIFSQVSKQTGERPFKRRNSRVFGRRAADGSVTDAVHIEVHTGLVDGKSYFAAAGPHKERPRQYQWDGPTPWDTRLADTPVFPGDRIGELIDLVEAVFAAHGLEIIEPERETGDTESKWDLAPETRFQINHGDIVSIAEMEATLLPGEGYRGVLEFDWGKSDSGTRHHAFMRERGSKRLCITDHYRNTNHYPVDEAPIAADLPEGALEVLREMREKAEAPGAPPAAAIDEPVRDPLDGIVRDEADPKKTHANALAWLLRNIAFFAQAFKGRGGVVSIRADGEFAQPITLTALRTVMMSYGYESKGPRGGIKQHNPVDAWMASDERFLVHGIRMRPEMARPLFHEEDLLLINRYQPPLHPASGGTTQVFERNLERLIPDRFERAWVWNWLACLIQHPEWRMVGLAMVARDHGSGRGLLAETLQLLLGEKFVVPLPYDSITGNNKFNAEVEGRLLVYVNEARTADAGKHGAKNASREALRVFVEPNHRTPQRIEPKGVDAYYTRLAISTMILANSIRAVPIDDNDRRFAVAINGPQMSAVERDGYQAWMLKPENIGALYRQLRDFRIEQDRTVFDPYLAPLFTGRDMMIDANKSSIDRAWTAAHDRLKAAADLYTMAQMVSVAMQISRSSHADFGDLIRSHTFEHGCRIGRKRPTEQNWRIRYGGGGDDDNRQPVFAFDEVSARRWTQAEPHQIKRELDRAQKVVDAPNKAFNKALRLVKTDAEEE